MKKIFLTSAVCMIVAMPSYADIASGASSATCDSTTIGATEDSTDLEAQWTAAQYTEPAGQYLLFANNTVSQHQTCPAGSYCPGFTNQTFADASMGLNSCVSNDANFPNSAAGASATTQCYRSCNISNMGTGEGKTIAPIAHATAISGNDYYGVGTDTCVATSCDAGYHVSAGACVANTISITWDKKNGEANVVNQCTYGGSVTIPATPSKPGYIFGGWKVKAYVSCASQTTQADCNARGGCSWSSGTCYLATSCYDLVENKCKSETTSCQWSDASESCVYPGEK